MHEHLIHAIYYAEVHLIFSSHRLPVRLWAMTFLPGASVLPAKHWIWLATALVISIFPLGAIIDGLFGQQISVGFADRAGLAA